MSSLSDHEVRALARAFPTGRSAALVLARAGIPVERLPITEAMTPLEYWWAVSSLVDGGIVADGRRAVLRAAHEQLPYHPDFQLDENRIESVLVVGASPSGADRLRADRELRAILLASADKLTVHAAPAALPTDLEQVLSLRPHILHFACHGDGENLLFEGPRGTSRPVAGTRVVDILGVYRDQAGVALRGIVLNACDSADIAPLFARVADVVIAHDGPLSDGCAVIFAGKLYQALVAVSALSEAAHIAAGNTVLEAGAACGQLRDNLVVIGGSG